MILLLILNGLLIKMYKKILLWLLHTCIGNYVVKRTQTFWCINTGCIFIYCPINVMPKPGLKCKFVVLRSKWSSVKTLWIIFFIFQVFFFVKYISSHRLIWPHTSYLFSLGFGTAENKIMFHIFMEVLTCKLKNAEKIFMVHILNRLCVQNASWI